jgi:hypothetical protein
MNLCSDYKTRRVSFWECACKIAVNRNKSVITEWRSILQISGSRESAHLIACNYCCVFLCLMFKFDLSEHVIYKYVHI